MGKVSKEFFSWCLLFLVFIYPLEGIKTETKVKSFSFHPLMSNLKKSDFKTIFSYLEQLFPNADTELNYETPFQLLIAVILSAQTTDKQVNKVTATLFQTIKQPEDVLNLGHLAFEQAIKSIGLYKGKAKNIYQTSELLAAKKGKIPKTESELMKLPGV